MPCGMLCDAYFIVSNRDISAVYLVRVELSSDSVLIITNHILDLVDDLRED